jgi:hypothetical protein
VTGRGLVARLAGIVGAGLLGALFLLLFARLGPSAYPGPVAEGAWTARSRACFVPDGFYAAEFDAEGGRHFSWTKRSADLVFPRLDRSVPNRVVVRLDVGRPGGMPLPVVTFAVDGVVRQVVAPAGGRQSVAIDIPPRQADGATVTIDVAETWVPGSSDSRALGVVVDDVTLEAPAGHVRPSLSAVAAAGLAVMLIAAGLLLCGLGPVAGAAMVTAAVVGCTALLVVDAAFVGTYVDRLVRIGLGVFAAGAGVCVVRLRWPNVAGLPEWPAAAAIVLLATALKLAVFGHPLAQLGDAGFQVHRALLVHAGRFFFTSVTPKPFFEFPYPVALYVAAQPLWRFFPGELNLAYLLRGITLVADGLVALGLYAAARRQWADRRLALMCAALWPLARAPIEAVSNANLTNAFGQAVFGMAMGAVGWLVSGAASAVAVAAAFSLLAVAFLSHFGTVSVGVPTLGASAAALVAFGRGAVRRSGLLVLLVLLVGATVSYVVYYSHFNSLYGQTLTKVVERQNTTEAQSKLVAPASEKLQRWWSSTGDDYGRPGLPLLLSAVVGAGLLLAKRRGEGLTILLVTWAGVWAGLTVLGIVSPIGVRANLAAAPALVCLAGYALGLLWSASWGGRVLAACAAAAIAWDALRICLVCLGRI